MPGKHTQNSPLREFLCDLPEYKVEHAVGRGARSIIYKMRHTEKGHVCAGKFVQNQTEADQSVVKHIQNENRVLKHIHKHDPVSPHIVRRHTFIPFQKFFQLKGACLILEYIPGASLHEYADYNLFEKMAIIIQVCEALEFIHSINYIHADIKPDNILIPPSGEVKIIDFGFAATIGTETDGIKGTTGYLAPEQQGGLLTPETDVYNLGGTMYWLMTGENLPYVMGGSNGAVPSTLQIDPRPPYKLNTDIPRDLSDLILQCCAHKMAQRPTVYTLKARLKDILLRMKMNEHHDLTQT